MGARAGRRRLERGPQVVRNFRRFVHVIVYPADAVQYAEGSVTGEPEGHLVWEPLVESDEECNVN